MSKELFDTPNVCNPILPYDPVTNRLSFFRITVFDAEVPLKVEFPTAVDIVPPRLGASPFPPGFDPSGVRLGIPVADFFPQLLPDVPTGFAREKDSRFRIGLNGTFLPAASVHRRYATAQPVRLTERNGKLQGPKRLTQLLSKLDAATMASLRGGRSVILEEDRELLRLTLDARKPFKTRAAAVPVGAEEVASRPAFSRGKSRSYYPTYEIGLLTQFEQEWLLRGYSRGALVSAFTLAPAEELTLEVFTWDRSKLEEQREVSTEFERNVEASSLTKVAAQVSRDLSETTDRSGGIGLGVSLPVEGVPVDIKGNADVSSVITTGIVSSVETITEASRRASERFKTTSQVKVVQTRETGREERVTRKIRNQNLGRTLTLNCFEVVEHYQMTTRQKSRVPQFVLLVDFPRPPRFEKEFILAYEDKLQRALLSTGYTAGFEAAKKLLAQCYFDERSVLKPEIDAAAEKARAEKPAATPPLPPIVAVALAIHKILTALRDLDIVEQLVKLADSYVPFGEEISGSERAGAHEALGRFNFWLKFKMVTPGIESKALEFVGGLQSNPTPDQAYQALQSLVPGLDDEWVTTVKMIAANLVSAQLALTLLPVFPWLAPLLLEFAIIEDNMGLPRLIEKAKQELRAYELTASVPVAAQGTNADGKAPLPPALSPPQLYTLAELSEADAEFRKLQLHLEANAVYYMNFIIAQEDANVRYEKLKVLGVHRHVENRLLGFVGRKAVFPLVMESLDEETADFLNSSLLSGMLDANGVPQLPAVAPTISDVSLPTGGLYMEASLGQCDALEPEIRDVRKAEVALAQAQVALDQERVKQMVTETERRQKKLASGDLEPA